MSASISRYAIAISMLMALFAISPAAQESPQQPQQTFQSASLVTIQASVRDSRGRVVSGLTSTDFEVRDNGQLRPISRSDPTDSRRSASPSWST